MFLCKRWAPTKFFRSGLTVETLASSKHEEIVLKSMSQTKERRDSLNFSRSDLWIVWWCHGIQRVHCHYCCLEPIALDENNFRHCYGNFFRKWHSESCSFWTITRHIENCILKETLQMNILRTWISIRAKSFIKTSVNMKQKSMKMLGKRSVAQKSKRALRSTLHVNRLHLLILNSSFSLKPSF